MNPFFSHPARGFGRGAQRRACRLLLATLPVLALSACAGRPGLYDWGAYQPAVYNYLKDEQTDYADDVAALEANMHRNRPPGQQLPPGFHAHLGMLYLKMGQSGQGMEQFLQEKRAFPEAAPFMDFLTRHARASGDKSAPDAGGGTAASGSRAARQPAAGQPSPEAL